MNAYEPPQMDEDQDNRTNERWVRVTLNAWGVISALIFARAWLQYRVWREGETETSLMIVASLFTGLFVSFIVVSLPFRVWQNVTQPERRRKQIWETVWCVLAFLALVNLVYWIFVTYPPDW